MTLDHRQEERLREAFGALTDSTPLGVEFDELVRVSSAPSMRPLAAPSRRNLGWLYALAAAAAILVLVGGAALFFGGTGAGAPVAATADIDVTHGLTWSRLPHHPAIFGGGFEQVMNSVAPGGPGLVAVGQSGPGEDGEGRAAVWTSPDGVAWSRVPHDEAVFGRAVMSSVTAGGPGLVAVGTSDEAAVWTSADGVVWSRVPDDQAVFGSRGGAPYVAMKSVKAGGPGLVAVGIEGHPHGPNVIAAVWTSPDGFTWSRVTHDEAVFGRGEDGHHTEMRSVAVGGPGLVAVGGSWFGEDGQQGGAAVWTSVDGSTWSRVPHDEVVFGGAMNGVAAGGPGMVAVGLDDQGAAVWTSSDGFTWSRIPHDEAVFGGAEMSTVTAGGRGLVAVGWDGPGAAVWTSVDGIVWSRVPHDEALFDTHEPDLPLLEMRSVAVSGTRLVAVGANKVPDTFGPTRSDAAVWVAAPAQ